jgi:hypothetical protein
MKLSSDRLRSLMRTQLRTRFMAYLSARNIHGLDICFLIVICAWCVVFFAYFGYLLL